MEGEGSAKAGEDSAKAGKGSASKGHENDTFYRRIEEKTDIKPLYKRGDPEDDAEDTGSDEADADLEDMKDEGII